MRSEERSNRGDVLAASGYLPPIGIFIYLWDRSPYRKFHGYQGIALLAYVMVAFLITDIITGLAGVAGLPYLIIVAAIYFCLTIIFALFTFLGKNINMRIYKSPVNRVK